MRQTELVLAAALAAALAAPLLPAPARAALRLAAIDGMTSTVMQQDQSSFAGLAARVRLQSDRLVPGIAFMPTMEFWRSRNKVDSYGLRSERADATMGIDARYDFTAGSLHPYLGVGYAVHFLSSEVSSAELGLDESESTIKGGLAALGGLTLPISDHIDNFIELKYHHIPDYRQFKINWGFSYRF